MKKILIIGGTGTISFDTTLKLSSDSENNITIFNRGINNNKLTLPKNVTVVNGDIKDEKKLKSWINDKVFDSVVNFVIWNEDDAKRNIRIFENHTKQFIYISTVATLDHTHRCVINELSPKGNKFSIYGQNKAEAEDIFLSRYKEKSFPITIVRPTQTYSRDRIPLSIKGNSCWSVIQRMIDGKEVIVHGDGQSVWASTHAEDFARGISLLVGNSKTIGEIYQIMNTEIHTWDMVYQILAEELKVEYKPVYISTEFLRNSKKYDIEQSIQGDKRWSNVFDISKLKKIDPNFKCKISLKDGLKKYLDYMNNHPEKKLPDKEFDRWCDETIMNFKSAKKLFLENFE